MLIDDCMGSYNLVTMKINSQLAIAVIQTAGPRARIGNSSDMTSQGTGPQAKQKKKLNKITQTMDSQLIFDAGIEWLIEPNKDTVLEDELLSGGGM